MAPMDQDTRGDDGATEGCESVAVEKQSTAQVGIDEILSQREKLCK